MLHQIKDIVKEMVGVKVLYFDLKLVIKLSPHTIPVIIWAVCLNETGRIAVMDSYEEWYELDEKHLADSLVISSLFQRVKLISEQYKKTG